MIPTNMASDSTQSSFPQTGASPRGAARASDLRRNNLALLARLVSEHEDITRAELARRTRLTKGTVSSLVEELIKRGIVLERAADPRGKRGRPPTSVLQLNGDSHCGVGVEINIDYLAVCVVDMQRRLRFHRVEAGDNPKRRRSAVLAHAARLVTEATEAARGAGLRPVGVAIGVPGAVDLRGKVVMRAPGLGWTDVPIAAELCRRLGDPDLDVMAENEANLAALGELWLGVGAESGSYVRVSGESGVGGGIVVNGALFRGARGFAGEIGHIVVDPRGPQCTCGNRGCLGRVAGKQAIFEDAGLATDTTTRLGADDPALQELLTRLGRRDRRAMRAVTHLTRALGLALADITNVIDPDTIVLGGIFVPLAPWLIEPLERALGRQSILGAKTPVTVRASVLGADAAVRGAATWVLQRLLAGELPPPPAPHPKAQAPSPRRPTEKALA